MLPIPSEADRVSHNIYSFLSNAEQSSYSCTSCYSQGQYKLYWEGKIERCFLETIELVKEYLPNPHAFNKVHKAACNIKESTLRVREKRERIDLLLASVWSLFPKQVRIWGFENSENTPTPYLVQLLASLQSSIIHSDKMEFCMLLQRCFLKRSFAVCEEVEGFLLSLPDFQQGIFFPLFQKEWAKMLLTRSNRFQEVHAILEELLSKELAYAEEVVDQIFLFPVQKEREVFCAFLSFPLSDPIRKLAAASYLESSTAIDWEFIKVQVLLLQDIELKEAFLYKICSNIVENEDWDQFEAFIPESKDPDSLFVTAALSFVKIGEYLKEKKYSERIISRKAKEKFFGLACMRAMEHDISQAQRYIEALPEELRAESYFQAAVFHLNRFGDQNSFSLAALWIEKLSQEKQEALFEKWGEKLIQGMRFEEVFFLVDKYCSLFEEAASRLLFRLVGTSLDKIKVFKGGVLQTPLSIASLITSPALKGKALVKVILRDSSLPLEKKEEIFSLVDEPEFEDMMKKRLALCALKTGSRQKFCSYFFSMRDPFLQDELALYTVAFLLKASCTGISQARAFIQEIRNRTEISLEKVHELEKRVWNFCFYKKNEEEIERQLSFLSAEDRQEALFLLVRRALNQGQWQAAKKKIEGMEEGSEKFGAILCVCDYLICSNLLKNKEVAMEAIELVLQLPCGNKRENAAYLIWKKMSGLPSFSLDIKLLLLPNLSLTAKVKVVQECILFHQDNKITHLLLAKLPSFARKRVSKYFNALDI